MAQCSKKMLSEVSGPDSNGVCHTGLLTAICQQTCMYCCVYSEQLLMRNRGTVRYM